LAKVRFFVVAGLVGCGSNAAGARVAVRERAPCAGAVALRGLGNTKQLVKHKAVFAAGANALELLLPTDAWERALETSAAPYRVLLISLSGFVTCPTDAGGDRLPFADAFLAGFSGGE